MTLTETKISKLTEKGLYAADTGLYLRVSRTGAKSWIQRVTIYGKRHDLGLGPWPVVSLLDAKGLALENRRIIQSGKNPLAEKRRAQIPTFRAAAVQYLTENGDRWKNPATLQQTESGLTRFAYPAIGAIRVDHIEPSDILNCLTPLYKRSHEVGRKLRINLKAVFGWCMAHGYMTSNPAGEVINGALPKKAERIQSHRALHYNDISAALEQIRGADNPTAKYCLEFLIYTGVRSGEARAASWDEIDLNAATWEIPASKMKTGKPHRVPLSDAALDVLKRAGDIRDKSGLVFPGKKTGTAMSDTTLLRIMNTTGLSETATIHGFRSCFRDWAADTGKPRELAEAALAHTVGGVEGAYFRSDLFERRAVLMQSWADFIGGKDASIIKIKRKK